jgi:hypothetical protein
MSKSNKNNSEINNKAEFRVSVVYGFKVKLKIVVLGEVLKGSIEEGMMLQARLSQGTAVGMWEIIEILKMDFINGLENKNFIGLILKCKDEKDFKLLQSLRVYDETVVVE